jgi:cytochrome b561
MTEPARRIAMGLKSTPDRYGSVAIAFHWASAAAIILAFAAGLAAASAEPAPLVPFVAHIILGSTAFVLTILRLVWWLLADRNRTLPNNQPRWQKAAAHAVHGLLYAMLLLMGTSGIATLLASGAVPALLAGGAVPDLSQVLPRIAHGVMSKVLLALFVAHVAAALWHQFGRRDRILARMGVGA